MSDWDAPAEPVLAPVPTRSIKTEHVPTPRPAPRPAIPQDFRDAVVRFMALARVPLSWDRFDPAYRKGNKQLHDAAEIVEEMLKKY